MFYKSKMVPDPGVLSEQEHPGPFETSTRIYPDTFQPPCHTDLLPEPRDAIMKPIYGSEALGPPIIRQLA